MIENLNERSQVVVGPNVLYATATIFDRNSSDAYRYREMVQSDQGLWIHPTTTRAARKVVFSTWFATPLELLRIPA